MNIPKEYKQLENARRLRRDMTPHERKLWYLFLRKYPVKIYKQRIIGSYIVDFYCASAKLIFEIDGSQHYETAGIESDSKRTEFLESLGLSVLRISNRDIDRNFEGVCEYIDHAIRERALLQQKGGCRQIDKMNTVIFLLYFLIVLSDNIIISAGRALLLDFLIGRRNRKNAKKIHSQQPFRARVNMGYIYPLLNRYKMEFKIYHRLYLTIIYSIIPQYAVLVLVHIFAFEIWKYFIGVYLILRALLCVFYRVIRGAQRMSKYAN